jgi:hypothetical protein
MPRFEILDDAPKGRFEILDDPTPAPTTGSMLGNLVKGAVDNGIFGVAPQLMTQQGRQALGDRLAGAVRGAGSIGATLMWPIDKLQGTSNTARRQAIDQGLADLGANTSSADYTVGKIAGELAGTAGVGSGLAAGVKSLPMVSNALPKLAPALESGGFNLGTSPATTIFGKAADAATRTAAGAMTGGLSTALVSPNDAGNGAMIGAAMPNIVKAGGLLGDGLYGLGDSAVNKMKQGAASLMQSALKPTQKQLTNGDASTAVQTLLDYGINPTMGGVNKIRGLIDDLNTQISNKIANSNAVIDKTNVLPALVQTRQNFANQVSPGADLRTIDTVASDFLNHPAYPGMTMPVQDAQLMKQGTYKVLAKKYGQLGSADTEAQKALARGLKDEIATAVPDVSGLNAEESKLLDTLSVTERRALMDMNKNPLGLAALAHNPAGWAAFMADKSALFKSLVARSLNSTANGMQGGIQNFGNMLGNANDLQALRFAVPAISSSGQ